MTGREDEPVDLGVLDGLDAMLGSRSETDDMLAEFLESAERWARLVAGETQPGATSEGHRAAHTLASSAAMLGGHALARAARAIELALAAGQVPDEATRLEVTSLLAELEASWREAGRAPTSPG